MSALSIPEPVDVDEGRIALAEYREHRRKKRIADVDLFDAFYKAYLGALIGGLTVYGAAGLLGDAPISADGLAEIQRVGPHWLGLLVAMAVVVALRSGVRGGPLAFERAEVRHVLMAPVDRRESMAAAARTHLRHSGFTGMVLGAGAGLIVIRRLAEDPVAWVLAAAAFGLVTGVLTASTAMVASGSRMPRWLGDVLALPLLGWALADALLLMPISPFSWIGSLTVVPLEWQWSAVVALVLVAGLAAAGLSLISRASMEAAERRSRLIGELRFAATVQDVRTVMLLQRQLAQEHPRNRPLIKIKGPRRPFTRKGDPRLAVITHRCWQSLMRWPLFRFARVLVLTALVSACIIAMLAGTTAMFVPAGLLLWLIAIDLLEPLAQEADHSSRLEMAPRPVGATHVRLLIVPAVLLTLLCFLASIPVFYLAPIEPVLAVLLPVIVVAALLAVGGAAIVVTRHGAPTQQGLAAPEAAGILAAWHTFVPPGIAVGGLLPLLIAIDAYRESGSIQVMVQEMNVWWYGALAVGSWAIAWVRYGDDIKANIAESQRRQMGDASSSDKKSQTNSKSEETASTSATKTKSARKKSTGATSSASKNKKKSKGKK